MGENESLRKTLDRMRSALNAGSNTHLKQVASAAAETAYLKSDKRLLGAVVASYSLAKFLEKQFIVESKEWRAFLPKAVEGLDECVELAKKGDEAASFDGLEKLIAAISAFSNSRNRFQRNVVEKSRIKAATQVYAHGASLRVAASLAGIDLKELSSYIGSTRIPDKYGTISLRERLKIAEAIFSQ